MKGAEEVAELIRMDIERFMLMELVQVYSLTLKEVDTICKFAFTLYVNNRKEVTPNEKKPNK